MRENMGLFRGKRIDNGEWAEGSYRHEKVGGYITAVFITEDLTSGVCEHHRVIPDTVGECTGLKDKNGKLIFEGDRVVYPDSTNYSSYDDYNEGVVDYDEEAMRFYFTDRWVVEMEDFEVIDGIMVDVEIIGNIHDNPELLKEGADNGRNN